MTPQLISGFDVDLRFPDTCSVFVYTLFSFLNLVAVAYIQVRVIIRQLR